MLHRELIAALAGLTVAGFVLWCASYAFSTADPERRELLTKLGMSEEPAANLMFAIETQEAALPAR